MSGSRFLRGCAYTVTALAAWGGIDLAAGRRAVLIHEPYCEVIARRLSQGDLLEEAP